MVKGLVKRLMDSTDINICFFYVWPKSVKINEVFLILQQRLETGLQINLSFSPMFKILYYLYAFPFSFFCYEITDIFLILHLLLYIFLGLLRLFWLLLLLLFFIFFGQIIIIIFIIIMNSPKPLRWFRKPKKMCIFFNNKNYEQICP